MEKMDGKTMDIVAENVGKLKEMFPEAFTEDGSYGTTKDTKIDFEVLKELLGEYVNDKDERYSFTWNGKSKARMIAQMPSTGTLRPCKEESVDWDSTQNIFIEGDNLEVLKLLQKSYHKKVKMIYIDPPYNTGKDFVYKDNFKDNIKNYKEITGQVDGEGRNLSNNPETSGRYHTDWLNMMYPRLKLARNLLKDDGVIFISIDDSESCNLKKVCDEIFGEENFINTVSINMKNIAGASGGGEDKKLKKNIEYLHVYTKNYEHFSSFENVYDFIPIDQIVEQYREEGKSWKYTSVLVYEGDKEYLASTADGDGNEIKIFTRKNPIIKSINTVCKDENLFEKDAYFKYSQQIFQTAMPQSSIRPRVMEKVNEIGSDEDFFSIEYIPKTGKNKGQVYEQFYKGSSFRLLAWLRDVSDEVDGVLCKKELQGTYWDFASETKNLSKEGSIAFPNGKKPLKMLKRLISMQQEKDDIFLDFFAGSATTAHAVFSQNLEDSGDRKFILIQFPERCDDDPEYSKQGYKTIAEISKERIRRAAAKIKEELATTEHTENTEKENSLFGETDQETFRDFRAFRGSNIPDLGFKVFKLDSTNIKPWEVDFDMTERTLEDFISNIKTDRREEDVLYEILLKYGLDLTLPIDEWIMDNGKLIMKEKSNSQLSTVNSQLSTVNSQLSTVNSQLSTVNSQLSTVNSQLVYSIGRGALIICLSDDISLEVVQGIAKLKDKLNPEIMRVVFKDSGFKDDVVKTNAVQILKQAGIVDVRSL